VKKKTLFEIESSSYDFKSLATMARECKLSGLRRELRLENKFSPKVESHFQDEISSFHYKHHFPEFHI
jgi:hypothetical protein